LSPRPELNFSDIASLINNGDEARIRSMQISNETSAFQLALGFFVVDTIIGAKTLKDRAENSRNARLGLETKPKKVSRDES
jgi:hypothetical protein